MGDVFAVCISFSCKQDLTFLCTHSQLLSDIDSQLLRKLSVDQGKSSFTICKVQDYSCMRSKVQRFKRRSVITVGLQLKCCRSASSQYSTIQASASTALLGLAPPPIVPAVLNG